MTGFPVRLPLAYAGWQLRDALLSRGAQLTFIGLLFGLQYLLPVRLMLGPEWATSARGTDAVTRAVLALEQVLPAIFTLIAVHGLVAADRRSGHYRLLFSKPVSVAGYYVQGYLAALATVLACALLLAAVFALAVRPMSPLPLLLAVVLTYALMGSVGFLLSALTRFDWIALAIVWLGSGLVHSAWASAAGWRGVVRLLLPPVHLLGDAHERIRAGAMPEGQALLWTLGYGALCFVVALVVVRRRPLGA